MNKVLFLYNFLIKKHDSKKINWSFIFPFIGVIVGSVIISLTVAIMEGMEYSIFYKLEQLSYPARLTNVILDDINDIKNIINEDSINKSLIEQVIISNQVDFRVVNMLGLEDFENYTNKVLKNDIVDLAKISQISPQMRGIRGGRISIIFQEPMTSLSQLHTISDQIGEALHLHRNVSKAEGFRLVEEILDLVGFPNPERALRMYPFELSGGLRQRAMIAMALVDRKSVA